MLYGNPRELVSLKYVMCYVFFCPGTVTFVQKYHCFAKTPKGPGYRMRVTTATRNNHVDDARCAIFSREEMCMHLPGLWALCCARDGCHVCGCSSMHMSG